MQRSLFSVTDARACGVAASALKQAVIKGVVTRLKRGWYTGQTLARLSQRHRLRVQAELFDHPGTVPSHHSGAVHLGYPVHRLDWTKVHLMRVNEKSAQSRPTVIIHQRVGDTTQLQPALVVLQTALICATSGLMAADHALRIKATTSSGLAECASELRHQAGNSHLSLVLNLTNGLRESPLESRTALTFHRWGWVLEPQFNVPGTPYRADARLRGTRVLVECDGQGKYDEPGAVQREKVREDDIRALGWEVVRVTTTLLDERVNLFHRVRAAISRSGRT